MLPLHDIRINAVNIGLRNQNVARAQEEEFDIRHGWCINSG
jgi:hypothetical protein